LTGVALVVGALILALVLAIAAGVIGREARRLDALPPRAVFDVDEAVQWVADRLPDDVTAVLSYDEVRLLLDLGLDHLRSLGVAGRTGERVEGEVVVSEAAAVAAVIDRAADAGLEVSPYQVQQVLSTQLGYLESISAVGPAVEDDGR
jgi:hypothetical protein